MSRSKRITLGLAAGALALGAGMGVTGMASAATTTPTPSASASADGSAIGGFGKQGGHRGDQGQIAADLATKLGVEEAKVTEALQAFREANKPTTPPAEGTKPDRSARDAAMAKSLSESLSESLGVEESKVTAALEEIRAAAQAERAAALKTRLDTAVSDGTLTQTEADAVTKAVEKGVIGGGR